MTKEQIELGRHALGLPNRKHTTYRNHFVTGPGSNDYSEWMAMVAQGDAMHGAGSALTGGDDVFWLTKQAARLCLKPNEHLDREARWPRG